MKIFARLTFVIFLLLAPLAARAQVVANPTTLAQFCVDRTVTPWVIGHSRKDGKCIAAMTQDPATGVTTLVPSALLVAPPTTSVPAADGAQDTTQNSAVSALNIYTPITAGGFFYYDTKRDVTVVPPNSTAINTSSHACYLLDNSAASTMTINGASQLVGAGVCDWGVIIAGVDGSAVWGKAHYLSDTATNGAPPRNSTGRTIVADEEDLQGNALDSSGNPATTAAGTHLLFGGVYKNATGFTVGSRGARNVDEAFTVADGTMKPGAFSTINGIDGSPTGTAPIGSQVHRDDWYDGTQRQTWQHAVQADGGYIWNPSVAGKPFRMNAPVEVTGTVKASSTVAWPLPTAITDPARFVINGYPTTAEFGEGTVPISAALVGANDIPATATANNGSFGVAGYARTASSTSAHGAVGVFGFGGWSGQGNGSNGSMTAWGLNTITSNCPDPQCVGNGGFGFNNGTLFGYELDINVAPVQTGNTTVNVRGLDIVGGSKITQAQFSAGGGYANAITVNSWGIGQTPMLQWTHGLYTFDGVSADIISAGTTAVGNGVGSQPVVLRSRDSSGKNNTSVISADAFGNLVHSVPAGSGNVFVDATGLNPLSVYPSTVTLGRANTTASSGSVPLTFSTVVSGTATAATIQADPFANLTTIVGGNASFTVKDNTGKQLFAASAATPAVSCAAGSVNLSTLTITNGLVTHC